MAQTKIIRVQRSDAPEEYVLIQATKTGKTDTDVDLLATEGASPFVGKVRERKLKDLQAKSYRGDEEEFRTILKYILDGGDALPKVEATKDLEIVAELQGEEPTQTITIVLRKRIEQISQRLGSIVLKQDDDAEVQLFDWTGQAVSAGRARTVEVADLTAKYEAAKESITQLETRLEKLVKAKEEQERQMLSQFSALLNEKKLKIRNQQRILSTANIDQKTIQRLERDTGAKGTDASKSRKGKRKAVEPVEEDESSDGFGTPDGDLKDRGDMQADTESDRGSTPEAETETEVEDDEEAEQEVKVSSTKAKNQAKNQRSKKQVFKEPSPPTQSSQRSLRQTTKKATEKISHDSPPQPSQRTTRKAEKGADSASPPPPPRALPFARRKQQEADEKKAAQKPSTQDEDEETASDDDEL